MKSVRPRNLLGLAVLALGLTGIVHRVVPALRLIGDDYFVLRPWSRAELLSTLAGSWDPVHLNPDYHRPLVSLLEAVQFAVFGLNARALHLVSLVMIAGVAWLIGFFIARETGRTITAAAGVVLFVVHPSLPDSAGVWIFNQMHLSACALMLLVLLSWQRSRRGTAAGWWPVFALSVIGFYVKEDTVMVLPALILAQALAARMLGNLPPPPRRVVVAMFATAAVLVAVRWLVLSHFYSEALEPIQPSDLGALNKRVHMLGFGPYHTLFVVTGYSLSECVATIVLSGLTLSGLAFAIARRRQTDWSLWLTGSVLMAVVNLPQLAASGWGRDHLVLVSAVFILAAAWQSLVDALPATRRPLLLALAGAGAFVFAIVANDRNNVFQPCTPHVLGNDLAGTALEPQLLPDLREYIKTLPASCAAGASAPAVETMGAITWRVGEWQRDAASGQDYRWAQPHAVALIRRDARHAIWSVRHPEASVSNPVDIQFGGDDGPPVEVRVTSAEWRDVVVPLAASWRTSLRSSYRVDVRTRVPAGVTPGVQLKRPRVE